MTFKPLMARPEGIYWYVLQTFDAATVAFRRFKRQIQPILGARPNESELKCVLDNGASIFFKSGKNFEDLRVETLDGAIIDEVRQQHRDLWPKVIRPMLARRKGWCDFYSTPNGFDHFYELFEFAQANPGEWSTFHAPSTEAPWWSPHEVESAKATMSEEEFAQEVLAEFREFGQGKVYINHGVHNQRSQSPFTHDGSLWSPYLPIIVGLDFNVGLMCWALLQHRNGDFYVGQEIAVPNTNTEQCALVLIEHVKNHKPGIILMGDASGKSNKTSASGNTDYSILMKMLKAAGIEVKNKTPESNPHVKDRVNMVNSRLRSADTSIHLWYHPHNCPRLKKDFERVLWKENSQGAIFDKNDPLLTHMSDAVGYPVSILSDEWRVRPGILHVIPR